jgi:hypothetical protein
VFSEELIGEKSIQGHEMAFCFDCQKNLLLCFLKEKSIQRYEMAFCFDFEKNLPLPLTNAQTAMISQFCGAHD